MDAEQAANILGVDQNASDEEVKDRYQQLVQKNHPDKGGSATLFKQIKEAYDVLTSNSENGSPGSSREEERYRSSRSGSNEHQQYHPDDTYELSNLSDIQLSKLTEGALGQIVTENRLTKKTPGITHPQTLTDKPLVEYIHKKEQPHFTLRFSKATISGETVNPENGGFLVLTDVEILIIIGHTDGDEQFSIQYADIESVGLEKTLLGRHKFTIKSVDCECRFKINHNPTSEMQISGQKELDREIENAEQFVRETAYQFVD